MAASSVRVPREPFCLAAQRGVISIQDFMAVYKIILNLCINLYYSILLNLCIILYYIMYLYSIQ